MLARQLLTVQAEEPMSGMTVVVEEKGSDAVAKHVITSSRQLYAKQLEEKPPTKQLTTVPKKRSTSSKFNTTQASRDTHDEFQSLKPISGNQ